jgi:cell division protein FtsW
VSIWIAIEALLNMAVMVNLMPHAGNALPLISYGGTNLLVTLAGIGILINISRSANRAEKAGAARAGGNPFGAVIDLRWRDRGRRVSRSGRPAGTR